MLQYFRGVLERHQTCAFSKFHSGVQTRRKAQLSATMPSSNSKPEMSICIHMLLCHMLLCNMMKHISFVPRGSQFETYRLWDLRTVMRCACRFFMPLSVSGSHIERTRSGHRMRRMSRSTWHVRRIIGHGLWFLSRRGPQYLLQTFSSSNLSCATSLNPCLAKSKDVEMNIQHSQFCGRGWTRRGTWPPRTRWDAEAEAVNEKLAVALSDLFIWMEDSAWFILS